MTNLNIFRRLNELETANLHLQVMLKSARAELAALRDAVTILHNAVRPKPTPVPKPAAKPKTVKTKAALNSIRAKKSAYARAYYAKKKAERAAKDAA